MGVRYYTVRTYHCPRCNIRLAVDDRSWAVNPHRVGPPYLHCGPCGLSFLAPAGSSVRDDEWETKAPERVEESLAGLEKPAAWDTDGSWMLGGCLGGLVMVAFLGVAIWMGARAIFENALLMRSAVGTGFAAALALVLAWPFLARRSARAAQRREVGLLIERIESSRKRMADPAY
ncbi:MAG: hypothetical protein K2W96_05750, partial [Gemmataceae bacterium]|nr:hypothetical protein [Gemmataceae bacterium]